MKRCKTEFFLFYNARSMKKGKLLVKGVKGVSFAMTATIGGILIVGRNGGVLAIGHPGTNVIDWKKGETVTLVNLEEYIQRTGVTTENLIEKVMVDYSVEMTEQISAMINELLSFESENGTLDWSPETINKVFTTLTWPKTISFTNLVTTAGTKEGQTFCDRIVETVLAAKVKFLTTATEEEAKTITDVTVARKGNTALLAVDADVSSEIISRVASRLTFAKSGGGVVLLERTETKGQYRLKIVGEQADPEFFANHVTLNIKPKTGSVSRVGFSIYFTGAKYPEVFSNVETAYRKFAKANVPA